MPITQPTYTDAGGTEIKRRINAHSRGLCKILTAMLDFGFSVRHFLSILQHTAFIGSSQSKDMARRQEWLDLFDAVQKVIDAYEDDTVVLGEDSNVGS